MTTDILKLAELLYKFSQDKRVHPIIEGLRSWLWPVFILLVLTSGFLTYSAWHDYRQSHQILSNGLLAQFETTDQPYRALEAMVLSGLDIEMDDKIKSVKPSDPLAAGIEKIEAIAQADNLPPLEQSQLYRRVGKKEDKEQGAFLVGSGLYSFLMVPKPPLRSAETSSSAGDLFNQLSDPDRASIQFLRAIDKNLCDFNGHYLGAGLNRQVAQTYFISETNVMAICEEHPDSLTGLSEVNGQRDNSPVNKSEEKYGGTFSADRDFKEHPYYRDTVYRDPRPSSFARSAVLDNYFHMTTMYIDVAGNSFVRSFCRDIHPAHGPGGMICFDVKLPQTERQAEEIVRSKLQYLGGDVLLAECDVSRCSSQEFTEDTKHPLLWWSRVRSDLNDVIVGELSKTFKEASAVPQEKLIGSINVLGENHNPENIKPGPFTFTIPVQTSGEGDKRLARFFVCQIRLNDFQRAIFAKGVGAAASIVIALGLLAGTVLQSGLRLSEQRKTMRGLAEVMERLPIPYCQCDEGDRFIFVNLAFVDLLGGRDRRDAASFLQDRTFADLLDHQSQDAYGSIRKRRVAGKAIKPYQVRMRGIQGDAYFPVTVHGAVVPRSAPRNGTAEPATFGLFLGRSLREAALADLTNLYPVELDFFRSSAIGNVEEVARPEDEEGPVGC